MSTKKISTQAEFEELLLSEDWLGADSVYFVGNGGTLKFTKEDGRGCKIPSTVKRIQGLNNAIIEVTNFLFSEENKAALWYETKPETVEYDIKDLAVSCFSVDGAGHCFSNCIQLRKCRATGDNAGGFSNCSILTDCTGLTIGKGKSVFYECKKLQNCIAFSHKGVGFFNCHGVLDSRSFGGGPVIAYDVSEDAEGGYYFCSEVTNCIAGDRYFSMD